MISAKEARELTRQAIADGAVRTQKMVQEAMDSLDWRIREKSSNQSYHLTLPLIKLKNGFSLNTDAGDVVFSYFVDHPEGVPKLTVEAEEVLKKLNAKQFIAEYDPYKGVLEITWPEEEE